MLPYQVLEVQHKLRKAVSSKDINPLIDACKPDGRAKGHKPAKAHPWRHYPKLQNQVSQTCASTPL